MTKEYTVVWKIEVDADNALEAAQKAQDCCQDKGTTATVFCVKETAGAEEETVDVDVADYVECPICGGIASAIGPHGLLRLPDTPGMRTCSRCGEEIRDNCYSALGPHCDIASSTHED